MIEANELRIGNYLYFLFKNDELVTKKATQLTAKQICKIEENENSDDFWEHIPLTPEILEKCGFEVRYRPQGESYFINYWLPKNNYGIAHCQTENDYYKQGHFYCGKTDVDIKTLHQLQNLYWCLCEQELKINL